METILQAIQRWFLEKRDHFVAFAETDTRLEGWLKGELIVLLEGLRHDGLIESFDREAKFIAPHGRKQVDFRVWLKGRACLCELKALCISQAAGTPRNLQFYFRDDNVGLIKDFYKLRALPGDEKWVLGFVYPRPGLREWSHATAAVPADAGPWQCVTNPSDFPSHLFLAIWRLPA